MLIKIYPDNPNPRQIRLIAEVLSADGVIIYPTDGVYAFGCSLACPKAIERIKNIRSRKDENLTIVCENLSRVAEYARVDNTQFKILKDNLPGAFTFILNASGRVPSKALGRRKTVGIRIQSNPIASDIVSILGAPLVTASVKEIDAMEEYLTDPELLNERYGRVVDAVVDGGYGSLTPTTIVDLTDDEPEIIRQGGGELI